MPYLSDHSFVHHRDARREGRLAETGRPRLVFCLEGVLYHLPERLFPKIEVLFVGNLVRPPPLLQARQDPRVDGPAAVEPVEDLCATEVAQRGVEEGLEQVREGGGDLVVQRGTGFRQRLVGREAAVFRADGVAPESEG